MIENEPLITENEPDLQSKIDDMEIELSIKTLEIQLLLLYVRTVVGENECLCGAPPFTDGNQCSVCAGLDRLRQFKDYLSFGDVPEGKEAIVDLDKLNEISTYLDQINNTPFEKMLIVKDRRPVELSVETLKTYQEIGFSNIRILERIYQGTWGGKK